VHLDPKVLEGLRHVGTEHYVRLAIFVVLYFASAWRRTPDGRKFDGSAGLAVTFPFYLLAAASLHGISLFTLKECMARCLCVMVESRVEHRCAQPVLQIFRRIRSFT